MYTDMAHTQRPGPLATRPSLGNMQTVTRKSRDAKPLSSINNIDHRTPDFSTSTHGFADSMRASVNGFAQTMRPSTNGHGLESSVYEEPQSSVDVGDAVEVPGGMLGIVRYVGGVKGKAGVFAGVELSKEFAPRGKNDGDVDGCDDYETRHADHQDNY